MLRAIVLFICLASAGGIAIYTYSSREDPNVPVYTVPGAPSEPARPTPAVAASARIAPEDRDALARELQRELRRVGCYSGEVSGAWTPSARLAMQAFVERVNAALPVDKPDPVLLSLVQGHREPACGVACEGQTATGSGACVPGAVLAKTAEEAPPESESDAEMSGADKPGAAAAAAGAGAGAAAALAAPATAAKAEPNARATARPAAASQGVPHSGPVPPEGMRKKRRPRRSAGGPPKVYKDFLKVLGLQ